MDYKEKYNQALKRARDVYTYYCDDREQLRKIESIFPELKESEGEEHRNWILEYLYDGLRKADEQFKPQFESAITWLEKQDNKLDADRVIAWLVANICDFEYYVKRFKQDFGL